MEGKKEHKGPTEQIEDFHTDEDKAQEAVGAVVDEKQMAEAQVHSQTWP
jgi:hypothetical protein